MDENDQLLRAKTMNYNQLPSIIKQKRTINKKAKSVQFATNVKSKSLTHNYYYPPVDTTEEQQETASVASIFLMIFINFLSNVVFSIVLPSLPDFLKGYNCFFQQIYYEE